MDLNINTVKTFVLTLLTVECRTWNTLVKWGKFAKQTTFSYSQSTQRRHKTIKTIKCYNNRIGNPPSPNSFFKIQSEVPTSIALNYPVYFYDYVLATDKNTLVASKSCSGDVQSTNGKANKQVLRLGRVVLMPLIYFCCETFMLEIIL